MPFDPSIIDWSAWYKADSLSLANNDPVSAWSDSSTHGRNLAQADSSKQPVFVASGLNALPAAKGDGSNDLLQSPTGGLFAVGDFYAAIVVRFNSLAGTHQMPVSAGEEANGKRRCLWKSHNQTASFNGYNADVLTTAGVSANEGFLWEIIRSGSVVNVYKNGTFVGSASPSLVSYSSDVLTLFANNAGGECAACEISEVFALAGSISANDRNGVKSYVADKYGLAIEILDALIGQEYARINNWSGRNVDWLQNQNPAGYSATNWNAHDTPPGQERRGAAGGFGNISEPTGTFADRGYFEAYDLRASYKPPPIRFVQTGDRSQGIKNHVVFDADQDGNVTIYDGSPVPNQSPRIQVVGGVVKVWDDAAGVMRTVSNGGLV